MRGKVEYHLSAHTGAVAASLTANSVLFAWRNPPTLADGSTNGRGQKLRKVIAKVRTIVSPTNEAEFSVAMYGVSVFGASPADYTGGTDISHPTTAANRAYRVVGPEAGPGSISTGTPTGTVLQSGNVRIADTSALSHGGTPTIETHPFAWDGIREGAAATTPRFGFDVEWRPSDEGREDKKGKLLLPGTGFVILNPVATGAAHTFRMFVEVFWDEA